MTGIPTTRSDESAIDAPPGQRGAFALLLAAQGSAYTAEAVLIVLLTLVALDAGAAGAALVLVAQSVPRAVLLPLGGVVTDRWGPARVTAATAVSRSLILGALAAGIAVVGSPSLLVLALAGAVLGALDGISHPAALSLVPTVVSAERLVVANSALGGIESIGDLVGPVVAAAAWAWLGPAPAVGAVAVVASIGAMAAWTLAARHPAAAARRAERPRFRDGLRVAAQDTDLRRLLVTLSALSVLLAGPVTMGAALLAEERFGGREQIGLIFGAFGAGSLIGLAVAPLFGRLDPRRAPAVAVVGIGGGLVGIALAPTVWVAAAVAVVTGAVGAAASVGILTWLQQRTPIGLRGRIMALVAFASLALDPLSYVIAGALLPLGPTMTLAAPGAALMAIGLASWWTARRSTSG